MNFTDLIFFHAKVLPDKAAIVWRNRGVTYAKLAEAILISEAQLRALGLASGGLVGVRTENPIRHLTLLVALYRVGIASVSLRHGLELDRCGLKLAAVLRDETATPMAGMREILVDESWFSGPAVSASSTPGFARGDMLCRVSLSSGTTGFPKSIAFTVDAIEARFPTYTIRTSSAAWDRMVCLPGLSTNYGFSFALVALAQGKSLFTAASARETLEMIPRYAIEFMVASTQQLRRLIEEQTVAPVALGTLRAVDVGGNVMSQAFLEAARTRVCRRIICAYGATETGTVAYAPAEAMQGIEGAVGLVAPWAEVEAVDDNGKVLPRGQVGGLRIRTQAQGRAYGAPDEGEIDFRDGWFYPGDRGMVTERGMMVVLGRTRELINAGGTKVAPELVEELFLARPDVKDAAALSMMGASGIEELWVAVVSTGSPTEAELITYCAQKNPSYRPTRVKFVAAIPRSALGKVARDQLREQLAAR